MEQTAARPATTRPFPWRRTAGALLVAAACASAWVWWTFLALGHAQEVRVLHRRGDVTVEPAASAGPGLSVTTGAGGFASIALGDGSVVFVQPSTRVTVTGARRNRDSDRFETGLRLDAGEISSRVPAGDGRRRAVNLTTKSAAMGVRGTEFTVRQTPAASRLMVTEGLVRATGTEGSTVDVALDFGTVVETGKPPLAPVALLPPPGDLTATPDEADQAVAVALAWRPGEGAVSWQVDVAADAAFEQPVARLDAAEPRASLPPLDDDSRYFWRVASMDRHGLRGRWSAPAAFDHDYYRRQGRRALLELDSTRALAHFQRAQGDYESELEILRGRGRDSLASGDHEGAAAQFEAILAVRPGDALARRGLAAIDFAALRYGPARERLESVVLDHPGDADALVELAMIDVREGRFVDGLERSERVLAGDPDHLEALLVGAMAAVGRGEMDRASGLVERALALDPDNATAKLIARTLAPAPHVRRRLSDAMREIGAGKPAP